MENSLTTMNRMLYRAIAAGDDMPELTAQQEETVIEKSGSLSFRFMREAIRAAGVRSLSVIVHVTQDSVHALLNYLHSRQLKNGTTHLRSRIEKSLSGFMEYLRHDFSAYFRHNNPMPVLLWLPIKEQLLGALGPGEKTVFAQTDIALAETLLQTLEDITSKETPSFAMSDYWLMLTGKLRDQLPGSGDPTLRSIYTLITWNFNCGRFVQYLVGRYLAALNEEESAVQQWTGNLQLLNRVSDMPQHALYPALPTCKRMLTDTISAEITACEFVQGAMPQLANRQPIQLAMSVPQIGVWLRAMCDTGMIVADNAKELTRQSAGSFSSKRSGAISAENLYVTYYRLEPAAISIVETHLVNLLNQCKKYRSERK
ncbi:MAG: hypothetical protein V4539_23740 [Bacteroidota bacterium]